MSSMLEAIEYCRDLLLADSLLVNGDSSLIFGVGSRVYWNLAPAPAPGTEQTYPFVIGNLNAGGANNDFKTNLLDYRMQWIVISPDFQEASFLGERIYQVLHDASPADKTGYSVYASEMIQKIHLLFMDGEQRFYRDGGIFRIRMNETV